MLGNRACRDVAEMIGSKWNRRLRLPQRNSYCARGRFDLLRGAEGQVKFRVHRYGTKIALTQVRRSVCLKKIHESGLERAHVQANLPPRKPENSFMRKSSTFGKASTE